MGLGRHVWFLFCFVLLVLRDMFSNVVWKQWAVNGRLEQVHVNEEFKDGNTTYALGGNYQGG